MKFFLIKIALFSLTLVASFRVENINVAHAATDPPEILSGSVRVQDGDTWSFRVNGKQVTVRPSGIDAPELSQMCDRGGQPWAAGWASGLWLAEFLDQKTVMCTPTGAKSYGRLIVNCLVNVDGVPVDLQAIIVRAGWAFDYAQFSDGRYASAENMARLARVGVWQGRCEKPWIWRRSQRQEHQKNKTRE